MTEIRFNYSLENRCHSHQLKALSSDYLIANKSFEPTVTDLEKQSASQLEVRETDNSIFINRLYESLSLFPVGIFYLILGITAVMWIRRRKAINKDLALSKSSGTCPCKSCQFFSHNPRLYCGVHPLDAMTTRAIDCPDYCPTNE